MGTEDRHSLQPINRVQHQVVAAVTAVAAASEEEENVADFVRRSKHRFTENGVLVYEKWAGSNISCKSSE